jgi:SAM-dependent methyltransferase
MKKSKEQWKKIFSDATNGHILWDGKAENPYDSDHAYTSAHRFLEHALYLGFFRTGNKVLDLGCGNGRLGISLSDLDIEYQGLDPMLPCIEFAKKAFEDFPKMHFNHQDIHSAISNPTGTIKPEYYKLPFPDDYFDDVICYSVFTHLERLEVALNYMSEIKRVLKDGGKFFITCYRSPPDPNPYSGGERTVYLESDLMNMLSGFQFLYTYGGHVDKKQEYYDQWGLFCTKL